MPVVPPLELQQLSIGYHAKPVGGVFNLQVPPSQLVGLMGINGIGKSTLLKTISGLLPPISGQVLVQGQDVYKLPPMQRARQLALVLTNRFEGGHSTVEDIVKMGRYPYTNWQFSLSSLDTEKIQEALQLVGIQHQKNYLFDRLSDGNKQKVMIARALAQDTPLLILDEPTVHLDIKNRYIILELLSELSHSGQKTILFSGHDLEPMVQLCDKLMLLTPQGLQLDTPAAFAANQALANAFDLQPHQLPGALT